MRVALRFELQVGGSRIRLLSGVELQAGRGGSSRREKGPPCQTSQRVLPHQSCTLVMRLSAYKAVAHRKRIVSLYVVTFINHDLLTD